MKKVYCKDCVYNDRYNSCEKETYSGESIGRKDILNISGECDYYEPRLRIRIKNLFKKIYKKDDTEQTHCL